MNNSQLSEKQLKFIKRKEENNQLYLACLFKYYEANGIFFADIDEIPNKMISTLASQLNKPDNISEINNRTKQLYRKQIRNIFGAGKEPGFKDKEFSLKEWFVQTALPKDLYTEANAIAFAKAFFIKHSLKAPSESRIKRVYHAALAEYERMMIRTTENLLSSESKALLDGLLLELNNETDYKSCLTYLRENSRGISIEAIQSEADKLQRLNSIKLPEYLNALPDKQLQKYYRFLSIQKPGRLKEMSDDKRHFMLAVFILIIRRQKADNIIEHFINLMQRSVKRSKRYIKNIFSNISEIKNVYGKKKMLFLIAQACMDNPPNASISKVIFPVVPKKKLKKIIKEYKGKKRSGTYREALHERIRTSYICHYRRLLETVLQSLTFYTNNQSLKPFLDAVSLIKEHSGSKTQYYPEDIAVPIENVLTQSQQKLVLSDNKEKVNRISYEICVLRNLRSKIKCKDIWVKEAKKYRNPDEDLPKDFDDNKHFYFDLLNLPYKYDDYINEIKKELTESLKNFNTYLSISQMVKILQIPKGHIYVPKIQPQAEPLILKQLKNDINESWPSIDLLDVLKETEIHTGFSECFKSSGLVEKLNREDLLKRLLLVLYAYGTNAGLKRMGTGNTDITYDDLKYVRTRYLHKDNLRDAIIRVVNKIIEIKRKDIWGESTTSVASDSKLFSAWDQNLLTQWHPRYNKFGVMIYWHVDKKSLCIHSQLKTCTSSEVAAMLQGVLHHCTNAKVKKNYTDTHGGSLVGFAFTRLFNVDLLVRFKNIHKQRLYAADAKGIAEYSNLETVINRTIQWDLIKSQYEEIVKYASALKLGTADAEIILKPFASTNYKHPTYQALCELGKAVKTIFLCRYLSSESLRQEIHESLNVVERWNGVNEFIFFGKSGEISTNNPEEMELSVLSLHLLQISMVYINTLLIQEILSDGDQLSKFNKADMRAITPLLHAHINPYGHFLLDMKKRIKIQMRKAA